MKELSARQHQVIQFIYSHVEGYGRCPTGPEIARHFRLKSSTGGYQYLQALIDKGYLERAHTDTRPVAIRVTRKTLQLFCPKWHLLSEITAGPASEVGHDIQDSISEVTDLLPMLRPGDFFLRVNGDSMIGDGIIPGQIVVVRPNIEPPSGAICAVWIPGRGGTLKRVFREQGMVRLAPANPEYETLFYREEEIAIKGVLVAGVKIMNYPEHRPTE
jgi:repressor LexA